MAREIAATDRSSSRVSSSCIASPRAMGPLHNVGGARTSGASDLAGVGAALVVAPFAHDRVPVTGLVKRVIPGSHGPSRPPAGAATRLAPPRLVLTLRSAHARSVPAHMAGAPGRASKLRRQEDEVTLPRRTCLGKDAGQMTAHGRRGESEIIGNL